MDPSKVLVGIDASDRIQQGQFLRLTFGRKRELGLPVGFFSFEHDMNAAFDQLDAGDSLAQPVSDLDLPPESEAAVIDVLIRPAAIGVTAAFLANYFDSLRFGVTLTSLTPIDVHAAQAGAADRDLLQSQLDQAEKSRDPLAALGQYARVLEWTLAALLVVALIYYGSKAYKVAKAVA